MSINVKPLADRVIIEPAAAEEKTAGGIIIPDTAKEKPQEGEVVSVGDGRLLDDGSRQALNVSAGDKVLFGKFAGTEVEYEGEEYLILREDDILAKIGS